MHQDKSTKLNLERNLRQSRRHNKDVPAWSGYEASEDDPRPIADPKLEWEADRSGMVHSRMHPGEGEVLEGYGTTNFGVSPFEEKSTVAGLPSSYLSETVLMAAGLATSGLLVWKFRDRISSQLQVLSDYALLLRESRAE